jgi:hypothetical protein
MAGAVFASAPPANAMPVAAPIAAASPDAVLPGLGMVEKAYWRYRYHRRWGWHHRGWGWRHRGWGWHRHWRRW